MYMCMRRNSGENYSRDFTPAYYLRTQVIATFDHLSESNTRSWREWELLCKFLSSKAQAWNTASAI